VQQTPHGSYKLLEQDEGYLLHVEVRGEWQPLYVFTTQPQRRADLEVGSWYTSTYPASMFVTGLMAAIVTDEARYNLRGRHVTVNWRDGAERIRLGSAAEVVDLLSSWFGVAVPDFSDRAALQARVGEVLDA
jgi:arylamine N-acetyltransferase